MSAEPPAQIAPAAPATARLFLALWPPPEVAAALLSRYDSARTDASARMETPSRVHLTLHFLGHVARERLEGLCAGLHVSFVPFDLYLRDCTRWPHGLVVAEPDALPAALVDLHASLGRALESLGLPTERRALRAHLTLARRHAASRPAVPTGSAPLRWTVRQYVLAESAGDAQRDYRVLRAWVADAG